MRKTTINFIILFPILLLISGSLFFKDNNNSNSINYQKSLVGKENTEEIKNSIPVEFFTLDNSAASIKKIEKYVEDATTLILNTDKLTKFFNSPTNELILTIPINQRKNIELELYKSEVLSEDFNLYSLSKQRIRTKISYKPGLHYRGRIKGNSNSIASISIFNNKIIGIISDDNGNYILGENRNYTDRKNYIFYNDNNLKIKSNFKCGTGDGVDKFYKSADYIHKKIKKPDDTFPNLPVKMYFECDYDMYEEFYYSISEVADFVTSFFNVSIFIYQNESIPFTIQTIEVWTEPDPYIYYDNSVDILLAFGGTLEDNFEGNLAHLLSTGHNQELGGIAWVGVLCQEFNNLDSSGRFAFSNIEPYYNNFPTYSWTVGCVTHEIGHNLGSMHTHACWWPLPNYTIGALDSCYYPEFGFCFTYPHASIGTIMSYCHLWIGYGGGINFNLGFGQLPGDTIRRYYLNAGCLIKELNSSEIPTFFLSQNYPNPFNPITTIKYSIPEDNFVTIKVYDINGKEIRTILNEFKMAGFYTITFDASGLSSGVYFYSIYSGKYTETKRMVLLK